MRPVAKTFIALSAAFMGLTMAQESAAFSLSSASRTAGAGAKQLAFISEKIQTVGPFAHVLFCKANPDDCRATKRTRWGRAPVFLTAKRQEQLRQINMAVNSAITPKNDQIAAGFGDSWALSPKAGDCEDYAITKRHKLISMGWPARAVRLAVTYTASGEGHMVLVVRSNKGDLVLDNRIDAIRMWNKTGLKWKMMQASLDPRKWVGV
ncbi:transglutaminase-like cysteine peptidase [Rhizobium sp. FKL33]|uniref:transglutaminase-like cysteine peptidase n=1 Tax=Rhizobium sp. FKL33 TaxID=2562307 RepID=UPI0010C1540F|nr:transglutaminase-like cysteine peptidase [Rhizobium sp. FKL33]